MRDAETLEFGVLGPLEVTRGAESLTPRAAKQRALLTVLLLNANSVVSTDRLIDDLWGETPPATAQSALQVHVSQLRRLLEPRRGRGEQHDVVVTRQPGYLIKIASEQLDLQRFERLVDEASAELAGQRPETAAATLRDALALWRGPALADLTFEAFAQVPAARLEELRLAALEKRIEADLACGRHLELAGELQELCVEHPLREGFTGQLMLALYRSGRQAEALDVYHRIRKTLVDELGIDPGPALQRLEREILVQDPALELTEQRGPLPTGVVTLAFTDVEDSTRLLHRLGESYVGLLTEYRRIVRETFTARGGHEVDRQGDGFFFAFQGVGDAVAGAADCQRAIAAQTWPEGVDVRVRIGLHTGAPALADGAYVGLDVHRAARIGAAAHGAQVLVSRETAELLREERLPEIDLRDIGQHELKGLPEPETLFQLSAPGLPPEFPPPRANAVAGPVVLPMRAVLVLSDGGERFADVLSLAEQLAFGENRHELVLAQLLDPAEADRLGDVAASLGERREELEASGATARVAAFTSSDQADDVVRLASRSEVDLLLTPARPEIVRDGAIDDTLASLLRQVLCDVAFLVWPEPLGERSWLERPVLVPFGAGEHDWAALELGAWLARGTGRPLHLLGTTAETESGRRDASRLLADAGLLIQLASGVMPVPRLVGSGHEGPVEAAAEGGLLVIGLSERWSEEGLGLTRWAIVKSVSVPVLFVRRGVRPGGLAPDVSTTRFAWSVTAGT